MGDLSLMSKGHMCFTVSLPDGQTSWGYLKRHLVPSLGLVSILISIPFLSISSFPFISVCGLHLKFWSFFDPPELALGSQFPGFGCWYPLSLCMVSSPWQLAARELQALDSGFIG